MVEYIKGLFTQPLTALVLLKLALMGFGIIGMGECILGAIFLIYQDKRGFFTFMMYPLIVMFFVLYGIFYLGYRVL